MIPEWYSFPMTNDFLRALSTVATFAAVGSFSLSAAPAYAVTHGLAITTFTTDNSDQSGHLDNSGPEIGDDRGGIALTTNGVLDQGDDGIALINLALDNYSASNLTQANGDALFTDLGTNTSYFFNWEFVQPVDLNDNATADGITTYSSFTNVTADGNVGTTTVTLSEELSYVTYDYELDTRIEENYSVLNGNGIVGIWDMANGDLAVIDISTGVVTHVDVNTDQDFLDAGSAVDPISDSGETSYTFDLWGVLEYDGTNYSYFGPAYDNDADDMTIARLPLTAAASDTVETFAAAVAGEDIWRIVPDCLNNRWYGHSESMDETLYAADATCTVDAALAETGFDASAGFGAVAALVAAGGLLVLRRRTAR